MRYFLDTEYDGFGGALLSIALVPEDGGEEFYAVIEHDGVTDPWVERNVVPFLDMVPESLKSPHMPREEVAEAREPARLFEVEVGDQQRRLRRPV